MTLKELMQAAAALAAEMRSLNDSVPEGESMSGEQRGKWEEMRSKYNALRERIEREQELREADQQFVERRGADLDEQRRREGGELTVDEQRAAAFDGFIRRGLGELTPEERQVLNEMRAQAAGQGDKGGYTVPTTLLNRVFESMKAYGGIASVAHLLITDTGNTIEWSTSDGTEEEGELIGENSQASEGDVTFGTGSLGAHKMSSKVIRVPNELLADSGIDMEAFLANRIASRLGRGESRLLVKGTGAGVPLQPLGLEASTAVGKVTASAAALTWQEINGLIHSIDPAYRSAPKFRLAFNDATLQLIEEMVDAQNRPLWLPGIDAERPATILKQRYVVDQAIASIGASAKFMYAGDFEQFIVRRVRYMAIKRLVERYADFDQTGFLAFHRFGCVLQDTAAIKALQGKPL
ncbi:TPA: phage major capsid protein [Pseudomonas aeruginosa]|nr:phage major capsid protein [Pseudomonas aeruginosa]